MEKLVAMLVMFAGLLMFVIIVSLFFIKFGWALFMVPVFGLRDIGWFEALGLAMLASAFKSSSVKKD